MKTCKEHSENPVFIYAQCAGCEVARYRKNEESMKQEIESLKKDAARYRWLRKNNIYAHVQVTQKDGSELYVYDSELDRSVDWAIYATKDHK